MRKVLIGSRGSALAMVQARWVESELRRYHPDAEFEIVAIRTKGDRIQNTPLAQIGGSGLFVKELELALLEGSIDVAVHSLKDLPTRLPEGLTLGAIGPREDVRDALVSRLGLPLEGLPPGARIGTSSLRRAAQLYHYRPDLVISNVRGNIDTRLRKAEGEELEGIVVAAAGLKRLGYTERITQYIPLEICLPAVGQGALAIEVRSRDEAMRSLLAPLNDEATERAVRAERSFLQSLGGGCHVPIGAYARAEGDRLELEGMVASSRGERLLRAKQQASSEEPEHLGQRLAERMLRMGAEEMLSAA